MDEMRGRYPEVRSILQLANQFLFNEKRRRCRIASPFYIIVLGCSLFRKFQPVVPVTYSAFHQAFQT